MVEAKEEIGALPVLQVKARDNYLRESPSGNATLTGRTAIFLVCLKTIFQANKLSKQKFAWGFCWSVYICHWATVTHQIWKINQTKVSQLLDFFYFFFTSWSWAVITCILKMKKKKQNYRSLVSRYYLLYTYTKFFLDSVSHFHSIIMGVCGCVCVGEFASVYPWAAFWCFYNLPKYR